MAVGDNGIPAITEPWPVKDVRKVHPNTRMNSIDIAQIVYVSIVGAVMLAAFLEWFLWLAAFLYCLVKVFQKAEHWSIRILAVVMMLTFTLLRLVTLDGDRRLVLTSQM